MNNPYRNPIIIVRPHLLELLASASERKLRLITGPSGYGKSILASQFAEHSSQLIIWHSVEEREHDLANLYAVSVRAIQGRLPDLKAPAIYIQSSSAEAALYITDILRQVNRPFLYYG